MFRRFVWYLSCTIYAQFTFVTAQCDKAYSCKSYNVTIEDGIECHGHYSCLDATLLTLTNSSSNVNCYGARSCVNGTISRISTKGNLICGGLFSCENAVISYNAPYDKSKGVYCRAEGSCIGANMTTTGKDSLVSCQGYQACVNTTIYIDNVIRFDGVSSGKNALVYSTSEYTQFYFRGMYSGDNATIYCKNGAECYIRCFTTGCNNLNVICASGSSINCTLTISCAEGSDKSKLCSGAAPVYGTDWIELAAMNNDFNYSYSYSYSYNGILPPNINTIGSFATRENSLDNCDKNVTDAIVCQDRTQCQSVSYLDTSDSNNGPICCLASYACRKAYNITSMIDISSGIIDNVAIRCDGSFSCLDINDTIISLSNNANIYFTGIQSLYGQNLQINTKLSNTTNMYCNGYRSCRNATFNDGNNLFSVGTQSTYEMIVNNFNNIFLYSYQSCKNSEFNNINTLYCVENSACKMITANNINRLIAFGYLAGKENIFNGINDYVFGFGNSVFMNSTFSGNYNSNSNSNRYWSKLKFKCQGYQCGRYSSISNFDIVIANGSYALNDTQLTSIKTKLTVLGTDSFRYSHLFNNDADFDNTNFSVCLHFYTYVHLYLRGEQVTW